MNARRSKLRRALGLVVIAALVAVVIAVLFVLVFATGDFIAARGIGGYVRAVGAIPLSLLAAAALSVAINTYWP